MTAAEPRRKRSVPTNDKIEKIGLATARLHKLLKELGHTRKLEQTAATMPDARNRLSYVDKAMHEASETTISAVETSIPLTTSTLATCQELSTSLSDARFAEHGELVGTAVSRLGEIASAEEIIHHNLLRIMEAQEFRDVAGQIRRVELGQPRHGLVHPRVAGLAGALGGAVGRGVVHDNHFGIVAAVEHAIDHDSDRAGFIVGGNYDRDFWRFRHRPSPIRGCAPWID